MSFAIHIFIAEKFAKESYQNFLDDARRLFGEWNLAGSNPVRGPWASIDDCFFVSDNLPPGENVRVNVMANVRHEAVKWNFDDYEWYLSFETSAGRSPRSLAVQLGSLLLAAQRFGWNAVVDRDSWLGEPGPVEFRSKEALVEHIRRVLKIEYAEYLGVLQQRGIINDNGDLILPD
jgi:hypothetical protein